MNSNQQQPVAPVAPPVASVQDPQIAPVAPVAAVQEPQVSQEQVAVPEVTADAIREQLQASLGNEPVQPQVETPAMDTEPVVAPQAVAAVQEPQMAPAPAAPAPTAETQPAPEAPVVVYTIETCPFCKAEKEYLQSKNITFTEKRVDTDEAALKEMLAVSDNFAGVPVTVLNTEKEKRVVKGFTQSDFEEELRTVGLLHEAAPAPIAAETPAAEPTPAPQPVPPAPAPLNGMPEVPAVPPVAPVTPPQPQQ